MQTKLKSLLIAASLGVAATLVFIACGEGQVLEITKQTWDDAQGHWQEKYSSVLAELPGIELSSSSEEQQPISSAEQPPPPSSSNEPPPVSSSSTTTPVTPSSSSSASTPVTPSSSSSAQKSSAAAATGKCRANNEKSGFNCGWDGYSASKILTPGTILKPSAATPPSGCTVAWNFAPDTAGLALNYSCDAVPAAGVSALGSSRYVLFAELTCEDGKHINACNPKEGWSSKKAPEFDEKSRCEWEKSPTTTARGGTPKKGTMTLIDTDHICGNSAPSPLVNYKCVSDNCPKADWPSTGIFSEWKDWKRPKKETYNVEAILNCPAYSQTVSLSCPPLEVAAGSDYIIECTCPGNGQCQIDEKNCKAGSAAGKEVTLKVDECVELNVIKYDNQYYLPKVGMRCQSNGSSYTVSINGKSTPGTNDLLLLGTMKLGDNEFGTFCLTNLNGSATSIKCSLNGE